MTNYEFRVLLSGLALFLVLAYAPSQANADDPCFELTEGGTCQDLLGERGQFAALAQLCSGCSQENNHCLDQNQVIVVGEASWEVSGQLASGGATPNGGDTSQVPVDGKMWCVKRSTCPTFCHNFGGGMVCNNGEAVVNLPGSHWIEDDSLTGPPCVEPEE